MMEYKGYTAKVEFDDEADIFHGQVLNVRDVITFQGTTVDALHKEFEESVEDYLEFCAERGVKPEKPFSGQFIVRVDPALHREIAIAAARADQSINTWVSEKLQQAVRAQREQPRLSEPQCIT
jgi:predicted HicB family RNase H-like nuclease